MDSEIPELHCHLHTVFCTGNNFETIICGEMLGTPIQCHTFVIYDDTTLVRKHVSISVVRILKFDYPIRSEKFQ